MIYHILFIYLQYNIISYEIKRSCIYSKAEKDT